MSVLVYAEHDNAALKDATLAVVTAGAKLGEVHVLVAGNGCDAVAQAAVKVAGVAKVLVANDAAYANQLAENVAPLVADVMAGYDAVLFPTTAHGKNIAPRVAALLDVMQISDILSVVSADTFTRPIYAGNAIATVQSSDAKKVITVRGTAFAKAAAEGGAAAVEAVSSKGDAGTSSFVGAEIVKLERPELSKPPSSRWLTSWARPLVRAARLWTQAMCPMTIRSAKRVRSWLPKSMSLLGFQVRSSTWPA